MRLLHIIKMIFNVSSFYNSSERVASLLVKITNQASKSHGTVHLKLTNDFRQEMLSCCSVILSFYQMFYTVQICIWGQGIYLGIATAFLPIFAWGVLFNNAFNCQASVSIVFKNTGIEPIEAKPKGKHSVWDSMPELTITTPYVQSRVDSNTFTIVQHSTAPSYPSIENSFNGC